MATESRFHSLKETADLFGLSLAEAKYIQLRSDLKPLFIDQGVGQYDPAPFARAWSDTTGEELRRVREAPVLSSELAMSQFNLKATQLERVHHHADLMEVEPSHTKASATKLTHNSVLLSEALEREKRDNQDRPRVSDINDWVEDRPLETVPMHNVRLIEKPVIHSPTLRDQFSASLLLELNGTPKRLEMKVDALTAERLHSASSGTVLRNLTFQFMGAHHKDDPSLKQTVAVCRFVDLPLDRVTPLATSLGAPRIHASREEVAPGRPNKESKLTGIVKHFEKDQNGLSLVLAYKLPEGEKTLQIHYSDGPEASRLGAVLFQAQKQGLVSKLSVIVESEKISRNQDGKRLLTDPLSVFAPRVEHDNGPVSLPRGKERAATGLEL